MTAYVTLPQSLEIDGITHVQHWRTHNHVVLQNYTDPVPTGEPFAAPQIAGMSMFHVFEVIHCEPAGERLGSKVATFTELDRAMNFVAKEEQLA
jgi:hypothetical protein